MTNTVTVLLKKRTWEQAIRAHEKALKGKDAKLIRQTKIVTCLAYEKYAEALAGQS